MKMSKDLSIIFILHPTISNDLSSCYYFHSLTTYGESNAVGVIPMRRENNFFHSSLFNLILDATPKNPTHFIYLTSSECSFKENFRLRFTSFSKVQMQLLSCIKFNFTSLFTFKIHPILIPSEIAGRFILATICADSQFHQVKNILLVDSLLS